MTANGWLQILVFFAVILAVTKPLGVYMYRVVRGRATRRLPRVFGRIERLLCWLCGVEARRADWQGYTRLRCSRSARSACS